MQFAKCRATIAQPARRGTKKGDRRVANARENVKEFRLSKNWQQKILLLPMYRNGVGLLVLATAVLPLSLIDVLFRFLSHRGFDVTPQISDTIFVGDQSIGVQ